MSMLAKVLLFLAGVLRPVFWLIGITARLVYLVLFSWWFGPLTDRWSRNAFAREIQEKIPFLFGPCGDVSKVVADPKPYTNDKSMGYVCVASTSLMLKFRRWRDENYGVEVAPTFAPTDTYDLVGVLLLLDPAAQIERSRLDWDWRYWGKLLEPRFRLLEQAFDSEHFAGTKSKLWSQQPEK